MAEFKEGDSVRRVKHDCGFCPIGSVHTVVETALSYGDQLIRLEGDGTSYPGWFARNFELVSEPEYIWPCAPKDAKEYWDLIEQAWLPVYGKWSLLRPDWNFRKLANPVPKYRPVTKEDVGSDVIWGVNVPVKLLETYKDFAWIENNGNLQTVPISELKVEVK